VDFANQGIVRLFPDTGIQFIMLNSCWQIDQFFQERSEIHPLALANALNEANKQVEDAIYEEKLDKDSKVLRIAVWHHAVAGLAQ